MRGRARPRQRFFAFARRTAPTEPETAPVSGENTRFTRA